MNEVLLPFGGEFLALTHEQFEEARRRGRSLVPLAAAPAYVPQVDQLLDSEGMQTATGVPASWFLEQARQGNIPHIRAGKYVRFRLNEVLEALKSDPRHADRLSVDVPKRERNQRLAKGCYRVATKN